MSRENRDKLLDAVRILINELPKSNLKGPKTEQMLALATELKPILLANRPQKMASQAEI